MMQLQEQIYFVIDGGLDDNIGYFGWVIATDQTILWENRGHVQGEKGQIETLCAKRIGVGSEENEIAQFLHSPDPKRMPTSGCGCSPTKRGNM
eukprot:11211681-Ditylum_brightwellii.AAC.1